MDTSFETTLTDVLGEDAATSVEHGVSSLLNGVGHGGVDVSHTVQAIQQSLPSTPLAGSPAPATLHAVQQDHSSHASPTLHTEMLPPPPPPLGAATPDASTPGTSKPGRKPRGSGASSVSVVDTKRREANRLAAERSRGRQQEKVVALEMAVQALSDENLRLKEEIARLEGREGEDPATMGIDTSTAPDQAVTAAAVVEAANAAAAAAAADTQAQVQADTQSRNILAALLSQPGVPLDEALAAGLVGTDDADTATWMHGVESLFKDAEASGRLGELAAVAAGQGEGSSSASQPLQLHDGVSLGEVLMGSTDRSQVPPQQAAVGGTSLAAPAVAVAINAEMEKLLREELAETRASIARVEQELASVRGQPIFETVDPTIPLPATLPPGLFEDSVEALRERADTTNAKIEQLNTEASVLREVVERMNDAHAEENEKVYAIANELRALEMDGGEQERDKVSAVLKALRATVTNLMAAPGGDLSSSPLVTPFSSPATARRRRGRPPKNGGTFSAVKPYTAFSLMFPSPPASSGSHDSPTFPDTPSRPTRSSARLKSRLAHEILATDAAEEEEQETEDAAPAGNQIGSKVEAGTSVTQLETSGPSTTAAPAEDLPGPNEPANITPGEELAAMENSGQVVMESGGQPVDDVHALVAQAQAHAHAHNDYLMSHLTEVAESSRPIPLDSSSFAAFLPQSPHHHDTSIDPTSLGAAALAPPPPVPQVDEQPPAVPTPLQQQEPPPNVLSRLKRGPPGSCDICGRTETTVWRKLTLAGEEHKVCNPCGLYHSKFGVIRPPELWGDGKSVKKRRTSTRPAAVGVGYDSPNGGAKKKRKSVAGAAVPAPKYLAEGYEDYDQVLLQHQHQQHPHPHQHLHDAVNVNVGGVDVGVGVPVGVDVGVGVGVGVGVDGVDDPPQQEPQSLHDVFTVAEVD